MQTVMYDIARVISRLREYAECKSDVELCKKLGLAKPTIASWRSRNSINLDTIIEKVDDISLDWLLFGVGMPRRGSVSIGVNAGHIDHNAGVIAGHDVNTLGVDVLKQQITAKDEQIKNLQQIILNMTTQRM